MEFPILSFLWYFINFLIIITQILFIEISWFKFRNLNLDWAYGSHCNRYSVLPLLEIAIMQSFNFVRVRSKTGDGYSWFSWYFQVYSNLIGMTLLAGHFCPFAGVWGAPAYRLGSWLVGCQPRATSFLWSDSFACNDPRIQIASGMLRGCLVVQDACGCAFACDDPDIEDAHWNFLGTHPNPCAHAPLWLSSDL